MDDTEKTIVAFLKGDTTVEVAAKTLGITRAQLQDRKRRYLRRKLPKIDGEIKTSGLDGEVEILRDAWGVAHIEARCVADGFFGLGYAMAQDRLWQLDHMRRLACGRLAEILGKSYLDQDRLHRTIGLKRSADAAVEAADDEVLLVLDALTAGINAQMSVCDDLPVEFDVLGYVPEPWTAADSVAVWKWRWWMLTGRLNILAVAEAGRCHLEADLFKLFMTCEAGDETIVPGEGAAATGGHDTGEGSNNWVVGGSRTVSGKPILATDPHNSVDLSRQWYQAQLTIQTQGPGGMDAVGAFFLGTPGIYLGHTRHTAWGVTNHTASARDVYVETPGIAAETYVEGGESKAYERIVESIGVRDAESEELTILKTTRGPLIHDFVPRIDGDRPLLSLKWNGSEATTGFESMLALLRSTSNQDVLDALEAWPFPILNFAFADDSGGIGYHVAGHIPERPVARRGFKDPNDPDDAWIGNYAFSELPQLIDPDRDWIASANNPPWSGNRPYLHLGSWSDGYRFRRIRQRIASQAQHDMDSVGAIHADTVLGRAEDLAPIVAAIANGGPNKGIRELGDILTAWDGDYGVDETGPTVFSAFWNQWLTRVASARFPDHLVNLTKDRCSGVACQILQGESGVWLGEDVSIEKEVIAALKDTLAWIREKIGPRKSSWRWGKLHTVTFSHPCAQSDELKKLLNVGPAETSGVTGTVRAAGHSLAEPFKVTGLSTYRMVVDMARPARSKATAAGGQSGHPGSPHYRTQSELWLEDDYHPLLMDRKDVERNLDGRLVLVP
jgi:penicillin G amidase